MSSWPNISFNILSKYQHQSSASTFSNNLHLHNFDQTSASKFWRNVINWSGLTRKILYSKGADYLGLWGGMSNYGGAVSKPMLDNILDFIVFLSPKKYRTSYHKWLVFYCCVCGHKHISCDKISQIVIGSVNHITPQCNERRQVIVLKRKRTVSKSVYIERQTTQRRAMINLPGWLLWVTFVNRSQPLFYFVPRLWILQNRVNFCYCLSDHLFSSKLFCD